MLLRSGHDRGNRRAGSDGLLPLRRLPRVFGRAGECLYAWKQADVKVTQGEQSLARYKSSDFSVRRYCTQCGGNVMVDHAGIGMIDVPAGVLPTLAFKPAVHLNYEETVLPMKDGLPKLRDFPAEVGGSGETMPE
jgi:hypothetical protein